MRCCPGNSPPTAARIVAPATPVDGHVFKSEPEVLERMLGTHWV
jgi:hypothetical protein